VRRPAELVVLGQVGRAHGLKGAFFVSGRNEPVPRAYAQLWIGATPETAAACTIVDSGVQAARPLLRCSLASDRTAAEALTNQWIYVDAERIEAAADDDDILWMELEGAEVRDAAGRTLGRIEHVYNAGASDVVAVVGPDGRTLDVPLVPDYLDFETAYAGGVLTLKVAAEVFDELWQKPT
jgi:16S rRNA processing protein RimM